MYGTEDAMAELGFVLFVIGIVAVALECELAAGALIALSLFAMAGV